MKGIMNQDKFDECQFIVECIKDKTVKCPIFDLDEGVYIRGYWYAAGNDRFNKDFFKLVCTKNEYTKRLKDKDMKTVKDAYDHNHNIKTDEYHTHICFSPERNGYISMYASDIGLDQVIVCTVKEYNDYAKAQKLNSINKDAAKPENNNHECGQVQKVKPVYTKEMADNGELPPVGSECLIKRFSQDDKWLNKGYIVGVSGCGEWLIFTDYLDNLERHHIGDGVYNFKPLDPRTDEEKLIDELKSCLLLSDEKSCGDKVDFAHFEQHANDLLNKFDIKLK